VFEPVVFVIYKNFRLESVFFLKNTFSFFDRGQSTAEEILLGAALDFEWFFNFFDLLEGCGLSGSVDVFLVLVLSADAENG